MTPPLPVFLQCWWCDVKYLQEHCLRDFFLRGLVWLFRHSVDTSVCFVRCVYTVGFCLPGLPPPHQPSRSEQQGKAARCTGLGLLGRELHEGWHLVGRLSIPHCQWLSHVTRGREAEPPSTRCQGASSKHQCDGERFPSRPP